MLLKTYSEEIFRPECNNSFQSLHCIAHLDEDISEALPYLNAVLDGDSYIKENYRVNQITIKLRHLFVHSYLCGKFWFRLVRVRNLDSTN